MDKTIPRILKSIVQTHGLAFTQSPSLCKAYLADLMPNFIEERQQLITAVAYALPQKLLETQNRQQRKMLASQFGQANALPPLQALQIVDAWFYALQEVAQFKQSSTGFYSRHWIYYISGLLTGSLVLLLGSAIAVYKKPEINIPVQPLTENTQPVTSLAKPPLPLTNTLTNTLVNQSNLPKKTTNSLSDHTTKSILFLPPLIPQWSKLDELDPEQAVQQTRLPLLFVNQHQSPTQALGVTTVKTETYLTATKRADQKTDSNNLPKSEKQIHQIKQINKSTTQQTLDQTSKKTQINLKKRQAETESLFNKNAQAMKTLVTHILGLYKKQHDRKALDDLFKLTGDKFYGEELAEIDQQIQLLNSNIDHLSAAYSKQVTKLCELAPDAWQDTQLRIKNSHTQQIQMLVLKHWQDCKTLSSQELKQHVLN